ncbi:MAG TPA: YicC family protein [Candidatus Sumerlaeota bacterium]|nr:YicC family protein [Candidatus Sumerlaeota bacterium]HPK01688.1 YicC family protein [Candidatus Sumerlaeota bacterium]
MARYPILSMTGYGRAQSATPFGQFTVEVRTVNNRFQDVSISAPREMPQLESPLRNLLRSRIARGKIDCRVRHAPLADQALPQVRINVEAARVYIHELEKLSRLGAAPEIPLQMLTQLPGVMEIQTAEIDEQALWEAVAPVALRALDALDEERGREGEALAAQLGQLVDELERLVEEVEAKRSAVVERFRERLAARVAELQDSLRAQLEPGRLEMEVALYADRGDVSEETVRLRAHLARARELLQPDGREPVGKNLDFLNQEILREINTICSKARDTELTATGLGMKSIAEQMREQVQNIQ